MLFSGKKQDAGHCITGCNVTMLVWKGRRLSKYELIHICLLCINLFGKTKTLITLALWVGIWMAREQVRERDLSWKGLLSQESCEVPSFLETLHWGFWEFEVLICTSFTLICLLSAFPEDPFNHTFFSLSFLAPNEVLFFVFT